MSDPTPVSFSDHGRGRDGASYGIIDPDYARIFTIARCIAWSEGYALMMHGSFTRDLDLLAVPWSEQATDAEHLVKRITLALDELSLLVKDASGKTATEKPHGRLAWTLTFKTFGDPRFVDVSVMPRVVAPADPWLDLASAPQDEWVLLATTGGWVGEALMLRNEETGEQRWQWVSGNKLNSKLIPLKWMPMPAHPEASS